MALPASFSIAGTLVGIDAFRVNVGTPHLTTGGFPASVGRHVLSAHAVPGMRLDTIVTLRPGIAITDTLSLYCS